MARDVGGNFDELRRQGEGGRRLDDESDRPDPDLSEYQPETSAPPPSPRRGGSSGGLADMLKDVLRKGRDTATSTGRKAADRARTTTRRRSKPATRSRTGRHLPPEGIVTIEYSPRMDGDPDPGEVVWTWVPFEEDPEQGKDRPVVVIGRRGRNLVGVPLTTKQSSREAQISIGTGDWDPKRRKSYARIWRMLDIDADRTRREGAVLGRDRFEAVVAAVDEYYDVRRSGTGVDDPDFEDDD